MREDSKPSLDAVVSAEIVRTFAPDDLQAPGWCWNARLLPTGQKMPL